MAGAHLLPSLGSAEAKRRGHHDRRLEGAQAHAIGHQTPIQFFLRDLGYERNMFCPLTTVELSDPVLRKRERSLHTCAQDVQITRVATI
jgi:hypothetical protein